MEPINLITEAGIEQGSCESLAEAIREHDKLLVFFVQQGCAPCGAALHDASEMGELPGVDIVVADAGRCSTVAGDLGVEATPDVVMFSQGREIARLETGGDVKQFVEGVRRGRPGSH